jgi:mycobactin salicyl-AMP ligase
VVARIALSRHHPLRRERHDSKQEPDEHQGMNSTARTDVVAPAASVGGAEREATGISGLVRRNALRSPERPAFADQPARAQWSGRAEETFTCAQADAAVTRLAGFLATLGLPAKSIVAVSLASGSELPILLAALDRAGMIPCLIPAAWSARQAAALVEELGIACVVTQSRIGPMRPGEIWRNIAAGYFGLRFILAFGPDVPDGVIDLDRMLAEGEAHFEGGEPGGGYIGVEMREERAVTSFRSWDSALAAARVFLAAADYAPEDRIVSLLAQDDHRALTTGVMAALAAGSSLELHGLFSGPALLRSLASGGPVRLVAPGWMEADLARLDLGPMVGGITLVHQAPVRFKARTPLTHGVVDALAFGELALLAKARNARGQFALSLEAPMVEDPASGTQLLSVRRDEGGEILFAGHAAETRSVTRSGLEEAPVGWRASGYAADVFAGILIGVSSTGSEIS